MIPKCKSMVQLNGKELTVPRSCFGEENQLTLSGLNATFQQVLAVQLTPAGMDTNHPVPSTRYHAVSRDA